MDTALNVARRAHASLELGQTKDAAWLALYALELEPKTGLALAALARIIMEVSEDPLATIATRRAIALGLPEPERKMIERFHRVDLWTRGLLKHTGGATILKISDFFFADDFEKTPRYKPWFNGQLRNWESEDEATRGLVRMSAALADAWMVPEGAEDPLRQGSWRRTEAYEAWCAAGPPMGAEAPVLKEDLEAASKITVLSDYWIEQEIAGLGSTGAFDLALERATLWAQLRPGKATPRAALVRLLDASKKAPQRDAVIAEILGLGSRDLSDLEEARVALGTLGLWAPQVLLLDQMERLAPGHPVILANRGAAYLELGEVEAATKDLEGALAADQDNGPALATLGLVRMREDEYVAARELLERAVRIAPEQPQVRVYLAACKNNQGDRKGAVEELEKALELEPEHTQAKALREELREKYGM